MSNRKQHNRLSSNLGVALFLIAFGFTPLNSVGQGVEEPAGYRLQNYNDIVPETLRGAEVFDDLDAYARVDEKSVIPIDVVPKANMPKVVDALGNEVVQHEVIPGSIWLPGVGRGEISDEVDQYFRDALKQVTNADRAAAIMIYCLPDCWMSWNGAKRAIEYGYTNVYWYPNGITGWRLVSDETEVVSRYEMPK